jgi:hypothetical protein
VEAGGDVSHDCNPPDPEAEHSTPDAWTCPICGRVWDKHVEDEPEFYEAWYEPADA